jgi:hypothetical protein
MCETGGQGAWLSDGGRAARRRLPKLLGFIATRCNERRARSSLGATCDAAPLAHADSYLVDPASSHMLVSKIKPCMSKYKQVYTVKLRMAH